MKLNSELRRAKKIFIKSVICDCGKKVNGKWDDCCGWRCWNKKYH